MPTSFSSLMQTSVISGGCVIKANPFDGSPPSGRFCIWIGSFHDDFAYQVLPPSDKFRVAVHVIGERCHPNFLKPVLVELSNERLVGFMIEVVGEHLSAELRDALDLDLVPAFRPADNLGIFGILDEKRLPRPCRRSWG